MSVWDVIEDKPAEAETMKLRASLIMALDRHIRTKGWTEAEAARWFGVTPPRISDLLRGKITLARHGMSLRQWNCSVLGERAFA